MSATDLIKDEKPDFRKREHRFSKLPFRDLLKITMKEKNIGNVEMQQALGYSRPNVIAMIKSGSMNLPEQKAITVAKLLDLPPLFVLKKLVLENNPTLWDSIESVLSDRLITPNELALVNWVRRELDGHDIDLTESAAFTQVVLPALHAVVARTQAENNAILERNDRDEKPRKF